MHFNILGAQKITNYVTDYIKENYNIESKEDKQWNQDLEKYNKRKDKTIKELGIENSMLTQKTNKF